MHKLHEGTVGQLNADFDATVEPFRKLVQTLQARTTGQVDSVAVESLHHAAPGPSGAADPAAARTVGVGVAHRHRDGRGDARSAENAGGASRRPCAGTCGSTSPTSTASC